MNYTVKTQKELDQEAFERGSSQYLKMFFFASFVLALCIWASKPNFITKAIDQELGIYKQHQATVRAGTIAPTARKERDTWTATKKKTEALRLNNGPKSNAPELFGRPNGLKKF